MTAFCNVCNTYVNQKCDRCGDNFGVSVCEKYACGGNMKCPGCGQSKLSARKDFGIDPYDFVKRSKEKPVENLCPCGFTLDRVWKYCPMCGKAK